MMQNSLLKLAFVSLSLSACATQLPGNIGWQNTDKQTKIELKDNRIFAKASCNSMSGAAKIENGILIVDRLASTLMACPPEEMKKDKALADFLQSRPSVKQVGNNLIISKGNQSFRLMQSEDLSQAKTIFVYIQGKKVPCQGVGATTCYLIRTDKTQAWQLYHGEIEGFKPEANVNYRLRIHELNRKNPAADQSSLRWILDMVIEQEVVKS